jgi:hypothetical protein
LKHAIIVLADFRLQRICEICEISEFVPPENLAEFLFYERAKMLSVI